MSKEVKVSVPNVYISDLEKLTQKVRGVVGEENTEISFEFIIASLFPTSWKSIQADLNRQYTRGYIQGRKDKEDEMRELSRARSDLDCYSE